MRNPRVLRLLTVFLSLAVLVGATVAPLVVSADENDTTGAPQIPDVLTANPKFPSMTGTADSTFKFEVEFTYRSQEHPTGRSFDLAITGPSGWLTYIAESTFSLDRQISAIHLQPYAVRQPIVVVAVAPFWLYPEPGDYPIELRATSGELQEVVTMTATITARYGLQAETLSGRLNTKTTAGNETSFGINVINSGTARMDKVTLSASKPGGMGNEQWVVRFEPETIENLGPGARTEVQVNITPPANTVAGDYMVTLRFAGDPELSSAPPSLPIRVSVATQTTWGIIGALIVVLVVAGLVFSFRKYGRR